MLEIPTSRSQPEQLARDFLGGSNLLATGVSSARAEYTTMDASSAFAPGALAVITGGAAGIGRAVAKRCCDAGMRVVLVDVDPAVMGVAAALGASAQGSVCDVADAVAVSSFAETVIAKDGAPNFLFCNAGVARSGGSALGGSAETFSKVMGINFLGVVNTCNAFVPAMMASGKPSWVVNTGSKQGITKPPGNVAYNCSKAALNAFTEGLAHELRSKDGCVVSAHLLVPGWTNSDIMLNSKRADDPAIDPASVFFHEAKPAAGAWMPDQVADYLQKELAKGTFYIICPDNETSEHTDNLRMAWAMQDYTERRPPLSRWHPDYKHAFDAYLASNSAPSN